MSEDVEPTAEPAAPLLRVVKGDPTPEELAALVAVVAARGSGVVEPPKKPHSEWNTPARLHRRPLRVGRGQWRASAW